MGDIPAHAATPEGFVVERLTASSADVRAPLGLGFRCNARSPEVAPFPRRPAVGGLQQPRKQSS